MGKTIRLLPSKKEIPIENDETVLTALEKAGYALPNNCRAGACGECKTRVCSGQFEQGFILNMALPENERKQGYALMCMARPLDNVIEIEYGKQNALPELFSPQNNRPYILTEKHTVTPKIVKLVFRSLESPMRFWPGQYIKLGHPKKDIPERCYSIANIPNREGHLIFFVTKVKNGITSHWLHQELTVGDQVKLSGPYGTFVGNPGAETSVLCLAAGSGLAPILSLANAALLRGGFQRSAEVLFSARTMKDLFELGNFAFLEAKFSNFKFRYTLTGEELGALGICELKGRIPKLLSSLYPNLKNTDVYIAGSDDFVADCAKKAIELDAANIHREIFVDQSQS